MHPRYRLIWLPAMALLLPCAFVGALGYRWLALEREAAERRGIDSARMSAAALTGAVRDHVRSASLAAAQALDSAPEGAPFRTPPLPALLADAFLFDTAGRLRRPDYQQQAGRALSTRAFELLAQARRAHAAGDMTAADRHARAIQTCCADARDEYGASLPLYATWLRVGWYASRGTARAPLADLAGELRRLVDAGFLGRDEDVTALSLLAKHVPHFASRDFADLVRLVSDVRTRTARRVAVAGQAAAWLSKVTVPDLAGAPPVIGTHTAGGRPLLLAAARIGVRQVAVVQIDGSALAERVAVWAAEHPPFDMTLALDPAPPASGAMLVAPLFPEAPGYTVVVRPRTGDPATDTRRDRLFASAITAALTLTLLLGCLAIRDVTREIGTASLRAAFVAGVTHELKTPVASIRLLAETLRQGRARPDTAAELLDTIIDESDRLTSLVDNVLTSSRIDGGAHVYRPRPVSLPDVVRSAIRRFDSVLRRGGFVLTEQIEEAPLHVAADVDALERSVLNLLGNAVQYAGAGRHIRVQVGRHDGHAEIRVADDGIGVPAAEQTRIFERFYRSPAAAADTSGTGLGLALARHFVEAHDGRISVQSEPGRGSVFVIALPLLDGPAALHQGGEAAV